MIINLHKEDMELEVSVATHVRKRGVLPNDQFWVVTIRRGDDAFKLFCNESTDIQVLIDLLKTEARKIGAYIDE